MWSASCNDIGGTNVFTLIVYLAFQFLSKLVEIAAYWKEKCFITIFPQIMYGPGVNFFPVTFNLATKQDQWL